MRPLTILAAIALLLGGCASSSTHSVSPASSRVIEAWVEFPPADPAKFPDPAPPEPEAPAPLRPAAVLDLREWFVVASVGTLQHQPERPETPAGVRYLPDGTLELGPGGHVRIAEGEGSGLETTAGELAANWKAESPTAQAPGMAAAGGGLRHVMEATGITSPPGAVLFVLGGLTLAAGVAAFFLVSRKLGAAVAAAGAAVLLAAWLLANPAVMLAACGLGLLAVVLAVLWHGRQARGDALALEAVASAVERRANGDKPAILEGVKAAAGGARPAVDRAISRAKRRAGLR